MPEKSHKLTVRLCLCHQASCFGLLTFRHRTFGLQTFGHQTSNFYPTNVKILQLLSQFSHLNSTFAFMIELPVIPANQVEKARRPNWLRVKLPVGKEYAHVRSLVDEHKLHTICES